MEKNKNSILLKSRDLFEKFGYQKTTLTDIARSVGKVKTAIYYYFSGKEEIFAELVKYEAEGFFNKLRSAVEKEKDPKRQLEVYIESRIALMQQVAKRYHFLKKEFFELMPVVDSNRQEFYLLEVKMIEEIIEKGNEISHFKTASPEFAATMLVNSLKGLEIQMFVTDQIAVEGLNIDQFRDFILYGIIKL